MKIVERPMFWLLTALFSFLHSIAIPVLSVEFGILSLSPEKLFLFAMLLAILASVSLWIAGWKWLLRESGGPKTIQKIIDTEYCEQKLERLEIQRELVEVLDSTAAVLLKNLRTANSGQINRKAKVIQLPCRR